MMSETDGAIYEDLAECHERLRELRQRDMFLVLAADAALTCGRREDAERLRLRLLQVSPNHMLRPFPTFADALQSADIQDYVLALRQQYPPSKAARLLQAMQQGSLVVAPSNPGHENPRPYEDSPRQAMPASVEGGTRFSAPERAPQGFRPMFAMPTPPPPAPPPYASDRPEKNTAAFAWVPTFLFLIVLILAAFLAGHQIFQPWLIGQP